MNKIILLSDFSEGYYRDVLNGIMQYTHEHGPWIICRMPIYYRETIGIDGILAWAKEWGAEGIIGQFYSHDEVTKFTEANIPVIAQDFKERFKTIPNITGLYKEAGRIGAEYFLKKGFKNFAFYGLNNIVWSRERAEGFAERIHEAGYQIQYYEHNESRSMDLWYYKPSELGQWLKSLPTPTAIMACDDNQAYQVTEAARCVGVQIPNHIAVLGVDNDEMVCNLSDPPLSSIGLDAVKGGYESARLMEKLIQEKTCSGPDILVHPTQVVSRLSTDIFSSTDKCVVSALKYIHENIDKNLNVKKILKEIPLSRRSLEKRFAQTTGFPVYGYIYNQRIEKFTQKLLETDKSIFEIALDLGLSDSKNIARQFKQIKGVTPLEYRKQHAMMKD